MTMASAPAADQRDLHVSPPLALFSILGFWLFYMVIVAARASVVGYAEQGELALRRGFVSLIGILLTWLLYLFLRRFEGKALPIRISTAFLAAIPCAILIALANYWVFYIYDQSDLVVDPSLQGSPDAAEVLRIIAEFAISRYFFLSAWAALYLALSFAGEVRVAERRAARYERAAQQSELRSLRYQVNPHFLFNTLNSLSSLVMTGRREEAETMIMSLSNFYRTSLTDDPLADVTLAEEVHLQRLYLDIEAVRFPERMRVAIDIPDDLMTACVPGLILQPLVENAIRYGVSRAARPVTIRILAFEAGGRLHIEVGDDGDVLPGDKDKGTGIGLVNVRDRLAARFGDRAQLRFGRPPAGGFVVTLTMPIERRGC